MPADHPSQTHDPQPLGAVLDFMRRLWALDHALQSISKRMETTLGLTGPQRLVIRIVGHSPGISAGKLAEVMHVHPSTLTGVLGRLEQRGLVSRKADKTDLRRALFQLTAKGRKLDVPDEGTVEAAIERALAGLPARSIAVAEQVLGHVAHELGVERSKPAQSPRRTKVAEQSIAAEAKRAVPARKPGSAPARKAKAAAPRKASTRATTRSAR